MDNNFDGEFDSEPLTVTDNKLIEHNNQHLFSDDTKIYLQGDSPIMTSSLIEVENNREISDIGSTVYDDYVAKNSIKL